MQLNQFSVSINPGKESQEGYVELEHNTQYQLSQETIVHLRLVAIAKDEPRPLTPYSTPVPPPV